MSRPATASTSRLDDALRHPASLLAGSTAGALEALATYPLEYVKTRAQLRRSDPTRPPRSPWRLVRLAAREAGAARLYSGLGAVVAGNVARVGVRFSVYDHIKLRLQKPEGAVSGPRSLVAALGAGAAESLVATTPSEAIKTKIIEASRGAPRSANASLGLVPGVKAIVAKEGLRGLYSGFWPTFLRQAVGSTIRFGSYGTIKNFVQGSSRPGQMLPGGITFGIGALSGILTVWLTMPFDVVKTRMQSVGEKTDNRSIFRAFRQICSEEGCMGLYRGLTPRLVRLALAGGITFSVYEEVSALLGSS